MRCMAYLAISCGVDGIGFWALDRSPKRITIADFPNELAGLLRIIGELRYLEPMLAAPDAPAKLRAIHDDRGVDVFSRVYKGDTVLIATNLHDQWVTQTFELEGSDDRSVEVLFEDRKAPLPGRRFTDLFEPYETHVYQISPAR